MSINASGKRPILAIKFNGSASGILLLLHIKSPYFYNRRQSSPYGGPRNLVQLVNSLMAFSIEYFSTA